MSIDFSQYRHLAIPEGEVQSITDGAGREIWRRRYVDRVPLSIGTDGKVYNGVGWKENLRLSGSSGGERDNVDASSVTGFIAVQSGDVIRARYDGDNPYVWSDVPDQRSACSIVYYDKSFGWLGSWVLNGVYGIVTSANKPTGSLTGGGLMSAVVPGNTKIAYVRFSIAMSHGGYNSSGQWVDYDQSLEPLIVTVNEEIE